MDPLVKVRRTLIWLRMCPVTDDSFPNWQRNTHILVFSVVIFVTLSGAYANLVYFLDFLSTGLEQSIFALLCYLALIEVLCNIIVAYSLQFRINFIFEKLSEIYEASKSQVQTLQIQIRKF